MTVKIINVYRMWAGFSDNDFNFVKIFISKGRQKSRNIQSFTISLFYNLSKLTINIENSEFHFQILLILHTRIHISKKAFPGI